MIKLFRNTRRQLWAENRFGRYLMYATGEIVLVVIGILVALKINAWNQNIQNLKLAEGYIESVSNDLKYDTIVFGSALRNIEHWADVKAWALKLESYEEVPMEYFEGIISSQYFNIQINNNSFNQMKNSEVLKLKDYKAIFGNFNYYYTLKKTYLDNFNEWEVQSAQGESKFWNEQNNFEIDFWGNDSIPLHQDSIRRKEEIIKILNSKKGRNMIKMSLFRVQMIQNMYVGQKEEATRLLMKIDSLNHK